MHEVEFDRPGGVEPTQVVRPKVRPAREWRADHVDVHPWN
jgi:hypothetical protein